MREPDFKKEPRVFMTEEGSPVIVRLNQIRNAASQLRQVIDLTVNDRSIHISDNRGQIAHDMVNAAENTLLAFDRNMGKSLHLSTKDQKRVLVMIDEVLSGKREAVQFQMTRNCDGIKEVFSREVFKLE